MSTQTVEKTLYNFFDSRENIFNFCDNKIHEQAASTACLVHESQLIKNNVTGHYEMKNVVELNKYLDVVYEKRNPSHRKRNFQFLNEPILGYGTAFLISNRLLLTAGHCVCNSNELDREQIAKTLVVFDFQMIDSNNWKKEFSANHVYRIKQIVNHQHCKTNAKIWGLLQKKGWVDWAILKLDRKVEGRIPLKLNFSPIPDSVPTYMLGYPQGLPIKYTASSTSKVEKNLAPEYFESSIDAFRGNSGSPVFRKDTNEVIGILCEGKEDYSFSKNGDLIPYKAPNDTQTWEKCQRISTLDVLQERIEYFLSGFHLGTKTENLQKSRGILSFGELL